MTEEESPPDVQSGMILKVLNDSPMRELQSAVIGPGHHNEYPEVSYVIINRSDFWYFAEIFNYYNFKLSFLQEDKFYNALYAVESGQPIEINTH